MERPKQVFLGSTMAEVPASRGTCVPQGAGSSNNNCSLICKTFLEAYEGVPVVASRSGLKIQFSFRECGFDFLLRH